MVAEVRLQESHAFPVPLKKGWDFAQDPRRWREWRVGLLGLTDREAAAWVQPGDTVGVVCRERGRVFRGLLVLQEIRSHDFFRCVVQIPGSPDVYETWRFVPADDDHFIVKVIVESNGPISARQEGTDRSMPPRVRTVYTDWFAESLKSRLVHSLENLEACLRSDIDIASPPPHNTRSA